HEIADVRLQSFLTEERVVQFSESLEGIVRHYIRIHQAEINDYIFRQMLAYLETNKLSAILKNDNVNYTNHTIIELIIQSIEGVVQEKTSISVHEIFDRITSIDHLSENVVQSI